MPTPLAESENEDVSTFNRRDFRLLLVEDDEINRRILTRQLEEIGIRPDIAKNGLEALEKFECSDYRLILMDCDLPRLDGYQTTGEIRRIERERSLRGENVFPVPIIALTSHTLAGEREKCLAAGMNDYLSKPVRIKELLGAIQNWSKSKIDPDNTNQPDSFTDGSDSAPLQKLEASTNENFVREILDLYLTDTQKQFEDLKQAAENENWATVTRIAHSLRGNSLAVGANSISVLMQAIEEMGNQNSFKEIKKLLSKFPGEFSRFKTSLTKNDK